jgi:SNF2 family DNA or RNA helicase
MEEGRGTIVYLTFTNQIVATDITEMLQKEFPHKVVKFLPSTVNPRKRKEWIAKNECDILICNPELVKTGLTLLQFPTIIFYESTYNVFTLKQASRRSWRIGQDKPVKVIFMAYKDTPQHKALELIGAKVAAANSLEGRLSGDDDLSSMGEDDDNIQLALAKAILNGESSSVDIKTTTIKNFGNDRDWDNFELYYQSMLESHKSLEVLEQEAKELKADLIENAVQNEKDGLSVHDGHGGNWGSALADLFDIKNNPNISICTMPEQDVTETKQEIQHKPQTLNSLLDYDGSSIFVYYKGKGKNQKRIEVDAANIADYVPQEKLASGVQLSLF